MKKTLFAVVLALLMVVALGLTACQQTVTLTLYDTDGTTVLDTVTVKSGEAPAKPQDPTKDGYKFNGWFITPTNKTPFDFTKPLTEDAKAYAQWSTANYNDERDWVFVGTMNNWQAKKGYHFTKSATQGNVFTYTVDLDLGAAFKCTVRNDDGTLDYNDTEKGADVYFGLLQNPGEYFASGGGLGEGTSDIACAKEGNYTFTLTTDPVNINNKLSFVYNGEKTGEPIVADEVIYYLKGEMITDWKDLLAPSTILAEGKTETICSLQLYLKANDNFMIASMVTKDGVTEPGKINIKYINLDAQSKELFEDNYGNIKTKKAGKYSLTLDTTKNILSASLDETFVPQEADYYIDGTFNGNAADDWKNYNFNAQYKLVQDETKDYIYKLEHVHLVADKQIIVQIFKKGSTESGTWNTPTYNGLGKYDYSYLFNGGDNFSDVGNGNNNILIKKTSDYTITLNSLSGKITIEDENISDDAYVYGTMTGGGWQVDADWKMTYDETAKTYTLTKAFAENDQFGIRICIGNSTEQRSWCAWADLTATPTGFEAAGTNIKCTAAGTYTVVVDMNGAKPTITISAAAAE